MTSEPDSTPRRRPPTIDLTAKEVEPDEPGSTQQSAAADAAKDRMAEADAPRERAGRNFLRSGKPYAVGAIVGAIAVGAIIGGFWIAGFVPSHETAAPPSAPGATATSADEISSRLDKIQQALQAPRPEQALTARVAAAEAQTKSLGDSLAALNRRFDDVAAASQGALAQAKAAAAAAEGAKSAAQTGVQRSDVDALNSRIAALESALKSLSVDVAHRTPSADDRAARLTVATEGLRAAVERGAPYPAELAAAKSLGADQNATASLEPFAADGVPDATALAHELSMLTPALLQASGAGPSQGSFLGRLQANAQKLVRIAPIDAPAGDAASSMITRINADAARGDIAAALAEIGRLPDAARSLAENWTKKAEAREAAIAASRRIATDALAALGRPAPQ